MNAANLLRTVTIPIMESGRAYAQCYYGPDSPEAADAERRLQEARDTLARYEREDQEQGHAR